MLRQANHYEKTLFEVVRENSLVFYYEDISKVVDNERFKIEVEKKKEEMVGKAYITFPCGDRKDYEIRYNRITNLSDGYTLLVPRA